MVGGVLGQGKGSLGGCAVTGEASGEAEIHGVEEGRGTDSFIPTELAKPQRHSVVMALKSEDLSSGFRHGKVMAFINDRMSRHAKGPEFYLENVSLSWEKVEDKLRAILEDRLVPSQAKEACAWSSLALGVRFAYKQSQLHRHRVQWLHDFAGLHRSAAQALASDLTLLAAQHEVECKEIGRAHV